MADINGVDPPPLNDTNYVNKINNSLNAIDAHDHTSGKGKPVAINFTDAPSITGVLPVANGGTGSGTQNFVGLTGDQTIAGNKTFTGEFRLSFTDDASTGAITALSTTSRSGIRLTAAATSIQGIASGADAKLVAVYNDTGSSINIENQSGSASAGDRVITGTGGTAVLANGALALFLYNAADSRWLLVAGGGGGSVEEYSLASTSVTLSSGAVQRYRYTGSAATLATVNLGSVVNNAIIEFYGTSDSNTLKLESLSNLKLNGDAELGEYSVIQFRYDSTSAALVEIARSDL